MLKTIAVTALAVTALGTAALYGLSRAAPERVVAQSFSERVASGAASLMMRGIAAGYAARTGIDPSADTTGPVILHVTFRTQGDLDTFDRRMQGFAPFLSNVPGLEWKVWTHDPETRAGSGTYMFTSRASADMYLAEILPEGMGNVPYISDVQTSIQPVMTIPTEITRGLAGTS